MLSTIALPGGSGLFEADVMRGDEVHERRRGMGDNAVGIFAMSVVDGFHAERPNYLQALAVNASDVEIMRQRCGAAYEIYAHGAGALANGMSAERLATIAAGLRPANLTSEEGIGYDMATALLGGGMLASPIWERALAVFGGEGTREIVYLVGHYCFNDTERLCDFRP